VVFLLDMRRWKMDRLLPGSKKSCAALGLALALAAPASAGTLYRWTAEDGSVAYTDDLKRVPEAQRARAVATKTGDLADYERFTPTRVETTDEQARRREARLERLRALNGAPAPVAGAAPAPAPAATGSTVVRLDDNIALEIPNSQLVGDDPIIVQSERVRAPGDFYSTHVLVVRQGNRVLSVVKPTLPSQSNPKDWDDRGRELFGE
jgi:hypothetical protein